jgi:hypothetical protein
MKKSELICILNRTWNALNKEHSRTDAVVAAIIVASVMYFIGGVIKCLYLLLTLL